MTYQSSYLYRTYRIKHIYECITSEIKLPYTYCRLQYNILEGLVHVYLSGETKLQNNLKLRKGLFDLTFNYYWTTQYLYKHLGQKNTTNLV